MVVFYFISNSAYNYPLGSYNTNHYYQQQKPHFYQEHDRINWPKSPRISRLPGDYQAQLHKTSSANHVGLNQMMVNIVIIVIIGIVVR